MNALLSANMHNYQKNVKVNKRNLEKLHKCR